MPEGLAPGGPGPGRLGFIFCGSGPQYPGMCREEYQQDEAFRAAFDRCVSCLDRWLDVPLKDVMFGSEGARLGEIQFMSASIFACQFALLGYWRAHGVVPAACLSNSLGTHAGAIAAGAIDLGEASELLRIRCELVERLCEPGGMAVVEQPLEVVQALLRRQGIDIDIAAVNGEAWTTCSGARPDIERLVHAAREAGMASRVHAISHGFHSRQMDAVRDAYHAALSWMKPRTPRLPLHTTVTVGAQRVDAQFWFAQLRQSIRFRRAYERFRQDFDGAAIELSPDRAFGRFAQQVEGGHGVPKAIFFSMVRNEPGCLSKCRDEVAWYMGSDATSQA